MSHDLLLALQRARAFDGTPPEDALAELHVPFDDLTGSEKYETTLGAALGRGERVTLVGASGAGKSSITAHVLGPPRLDIVPIRVRVGDEDEDVATHAVAFSKHLVHTIATFLKESPHGNESAIAKLDNRLRGSGSPRAKKFGVSIPVSLLQNASLTFELGGVVKQGELSGQDIVSTAQQALHLIRASGLRPVLVLDDTDHWLSRPGLPDTATLRAGFFGVVVRTIAERFSEAAAVIAVHTSYLTDPSYVDAMQFMDTAIDLPRVPDTVGIAKVLGRRANRALGRDDAAGVVDLISADATERLLDFHRSEPSLRRLVRVVHGSLTHACDAGASLIGVSHVNQAVVDL